jgi:putative transposase
MILRIRSERGLSRCCLWGSITRSRFGGLPGRTSALGDLLGRLPVCALPAQMPGGTRRREVSKDAELLVLWPENAALRRRIRRGSLPAGRPAVARGTDPTDPPTSLGRGVRCDPGDAARLALERGCGQMGLCEPAASRTRPPTAAAIRKLVIRMAAGKSHWGRRRVRGELIKLGHRIAASTVRQILHDAGINPAPCRTSPT